MFTKANIRPRVAVVFGGPSHEYEVSCQSAANVLRTLDRDRFTVKPIRVTRTGAWIAADQAGSYHAMDVEKLLHLTRDELLEPKHRNGTNVAAAAAALEDTDVVFPVMHGGYGEDGTIQALLDLIGVPYVGNGIFASAAGMDKQQTKRLLVAEGLNVADGVVLDGNDVTIDEATKDRLGLPVFVKPARSGSSIGVTRVSRWSDLASAIELARRSDSKVLVERGVSGREVEVGVLQRPDGTVEAGPPLEVVLPHSTEFFDYDAKYTDASVELRVPADLDAEIVAQLHKVALDVFRILGCKGILRVDFFLQPHQGRVVPVVNEVNTMPGFTPMSQYPRIWKAAGIELTDLLTILIETAIQEDLPGRMPEMV
ncbi:D-alanine--D-alanine ligase family protein [Paraburkholderia humisilvae]|uniref:D-alanine--D-alanine ligase n=1 Tax=Paraburkholderia humisilvae TaxID=627669 RepID=A0A6J5EVJ1_9BURK|nr:D-alanine--D-alanine ligase family protein [Paraburkholderia humisilvae]CAB3769341.1 D-alanine--D-alanine ligase [Paraburkholderia humisilvae]